MKESSLTCKLPPWMLRSRGRNLTAPCLCVCVFEGGAWTGGSQQLGGLRQNPTTGVVLAGELFLCSRQVRRVACHSHWFLKQVVLGRVLYGKVLLLGKERSGVPRLKRRARSLRPPWGRGGQMRVGHYRQGWEKIKGKNRRQRESGVGRGNRRSQTGDGERGGGGW